MGALFALGAKSGWIIEESLCDVRLGQPERILDQVELRPVVGHDDLHDVEAVENVRMPEQIEPRKRAAGDELLLFASHRFAWRAELQAPPRLHFDEGKRVAGLVAADDIDFAPARPAIVSV